MHRDQQQEKGFKPERRHARKEWEADRAEQHQMEAREHARQHGRVHRAHHLREAEAERQIRELRSLY